MTNEWPYWHAPTACQMVSDYICNFYVMFDLLFLLMFLSIVSYMYAGLELSPKYQQQQQQQQQCHSVDYLEKFMYKSVYCFRRQVHSASQAKPAETDSCMWKVNKYKMKPVPNNRLLWEVLHLYMSKIILFFLLFMHLIVFYIGSPPPPAQNEPVKPWIQTSHMKLHIKQILRKTKQLSDCDFTSTEQIIILYKTIKWFKVQLWPMAAVES